MTLGGIMDTYEKAVIAGLLANVGDVLMHLIGFLSLKTTMTGHYIASLIFFGRNITPLRFLIGEIAHFVAGGLTGILLWLLFKYFGDKRPYLKSIGLLMGMWILHVVVIPNIINRPRPIVVRSEMEAIVDLISHLVYGVIAVAIFRKTKLISTVPAK